MLRKGRQGEFAQAVTMFEGRLPRREREGAEAQIARDRLPAVKTSSARALPGAPGFVVIEGQARGRSRTRKKFPPPRGVGEFFGEIA